MKEITRDGSVWSSDELANYGATVSFKTVEQVQELIKLIENFDNVNKATGEKLFKYTVSNEYAYIEIFDGDGEQLCDVDNVMIYSGELFFDLKSKYTATVFEVGGYSIDDLKSIIKEMNS